MLFGFAFLLLIACAFPPKSKQKKPAVSTSAINLEWEKRKLFRENYLSPTQGISPELREINIGIFTKRLTDSTDPWERKDLKYQIQVLMKMRHSGIPEKSNADATSSKLKGLANKEIFQRQIGSSDMAQNPEKNPITRPVETGNLKLGPVVHEEIQPIDVVSTKKLKVEAIFHNEIQPTDVNIAQNIEKNPLTKQVETGNLNMGPAQKPEKNLFLEQPETDVGLVVHERIQHIEVDHNFKNIPVTRVKTGKKELEPIMNVAEQYKNIQVPGLSHTEILKDLAHAGNWKSVAIAAAVTAVAAAAGTAAFVALTVKLPPLGPDNLSKHFINNVTTSTKDTGVVGNPISTIIKSDGN